MSFFGSIKSRFSKKGSEKSAAAEASSSSQPAQPPPAYTPFDTPPAPPRNDTGVGLRAQDVTNDDDPYAFLAHFDTIFLIDDSGSMAGARWREVQTVLNQIVPVCAVHDEDGIDIEFLNSRTKFQNVKDPAAVDDVFRKIFPTAATPTGRRVREILDPYLCEFEAAVRGGKRPSKTGLKPINLIVITDGEPNDRAPNLLPVVLEDIAQRLDKIRAPAHQIGVQFFQVGRDRTAARALRDLDDNLGGKVKGGKLRDIVDTATFDVDDGETSVLTYEAVLKVVLGAVVRKVDQKHIPDQRQ
ncbi:uncharacterized protein PgNI_06989 [Pyricularia grisea]|uniref:VWFA domain-containing protein n=1 Tax=Pyricularia grisea TaxID=148305 RepID=A0A6P8B025_PYRGI|nr:uncharacterized protein PgNI_06989 [Pyricularia grisea]TLD08260.1 hypothetical protein PgNI_06989 [Pyricularia grisea]